MSREAMQQAMEALEEIALAGMSGSGQESEEGMRAWHARQAWKFIGIAARALDPLRAALQPTDAADDPCCGEYERCTRPCTPRGQWLGERKARAAIDVPDVADPILPPHPEHGWTWTDAEIRFLLAWAADYARRCVMQATREQAEHRAALEAQQEPVAWQDVHDHTNLYWRKPPQGDVRPLYTAPQPAIPQGWVPVTERLPEKNIEVLICFAGQNTLASTGQYTGSDKDVKGWCYPWENRAATDTGDDPVVTHWMPLPPPPKEAT